MRYIAIGLSIIYFLIFAYDIESSRDFYTWLWLLASLIWMVIFILGEVKFIVKNNK